MTISSKSARLSIALSSLMSMAFVQVAFAQADPRYQYQQRNNGTPTSVETTTSNMPTADRRVPPFSPTQKIPFDGGLSLFVLAGAGIAVKKRYDKRKGNA